VTIQLLDTSGRSYLQLNNGRLRARQTNMILLVFDLSNGVSFDVLHALLELIDTKDLQNAMCIVVATKSDVASNAVLSRRAQEWSKNKGYAYINVSAKEEQSIDRLARLMTDLVFRGPVSYKCYEL
jgi:50S ribosomal subunit-associated GTPase HflX